MTVQRYVLVVDDEERLTTFLKDFLSKVGYEMHVCSNGEEALEAVKTHLPSLVLLDMRMPGIDGVQVLQTLRRDHPFVKVIVMTSYDEEYKQAADRYGADAFFSKPLSLSELTAKIEDLLKRSSDPQSKGAAVATQAPPEDRIPKAKLLFVTLNPFASFLMKGAIHCVGDKPLGGKEGDTYPDAGEYEIEEASTRKEVFEKLKSYRPDFVLVSLEWKQDEIGFFRSRHITTSDLITELLHSPYPPKEVFVFGGAGGSDGKFLNRGTPTGSTALEEPSWGDFERQAAKVNRVLWKKCMDLGLTTPRVR